MENIQASKKQFLFTIFFSLISLFSLLLFIPVVQQLSIDIIQKIFHKVLRNPHRWIEIIIHCSFIMLSVVWTFYFLKFSKIGNEIVQNISNNISALYKTIKTQHKYLFFAIFACFTVIFFKVIISNFYYADDIWRNAEGSRSWIGFSRYISEFLSIFIHNNLKLSDIAPLPQLISLAINSITLIMLCYIINEKKLQVIPLIALSVLFISPFYSENISYRFDAPYMSLSVFFPILPFLFKDDSKTYIFSSIISIILTCFCYQAGVSIYILLTIFITLLKFLHKEKNSEILEFVLKSMLSFVSAMIIFKMLFMNTMSNTEDDYFSTAIKLSAFPSNLKSYTKIVVSLFGGKWLKIFTFVAFISSFITLVKNSDCNKLLSAVLILFSITLGFVLSIGPYIIFERPLLTCRVFIGFNLLVALMLFYASKNIVGKTLTVIVVYSCIVFQFCYGNCLYQQKEYQQFRCSLIAKDISELAVQNEPIELKFENSIDFCKSIKVSRKNYPIISSLITRIPSEGSIWNENYFTNFNLSFKINTSLKKDDMILIKSNLYHNIYKKDNNFIIEIKETK